MRESIRRACSALSAVQTRYSDRRDSRTAQHTSLSSSTTSNPLRSAGCARRLAFTRSSLVSGIDVELAPRPRGRGEEVDLRFRSRDLGQADSIRKRRENRPPEDSRRFVIAASEASFGGCKLDPHDPAEASAMPPRDLTALIPGSRRAWKYSLPGVSSSRSSTRNGERRGAGRGCVSEFLRSRFPGSTGEDLSDRGSSSR